MSTPLIVLAAAEEELAHAESWYEARSEGMGRFFLEAVTEAMESIQAFPGAATFVPGISPDLVKRFPFSVVFYRDQDATWIVAVAHQRRRPGYWRDRL